MSLQSTFYISVHAKTHEKEGKQLAISPSSR
jgi:hypothetical protein